LLDLALRVAVRKNRHAFASSRRDFDSGELSRCMRARRVYC